MTFRTPPSGVRDLFMGFARIGLLGFGGVAGIARHVIVVERLWLDEKEYAWILGLGQSLPGANTVNGAVLIGSRAAGVVGAAAAVLGLLGFPLVIAVLLSIAYERWSGLPFVKDAMSGAAAASAGIVIGTGLKMLRRLRPDAVAYGLAALAVLGAGIWQAPLPLILAGLIPAGLAVRRVL